LLRGSSHAEGDFLFFGTNIGADFDLSEANFATETAARLHVERADIKSALIIRGLKKNAKTEIKISDISCAVLVDSIEAWPNRGRLNLDGFTYGRIENPGLPNFGLAGSEVSFQKTKLSDAVSSGLSLIDSWPVRCAPKDRTPKRSRY